MAELTDKLYDAFGELIYVLAMSDGEVQEEELKMFKDIMKDHEWAKQIEWSFNYEKGKNRNLADLYDKVKFACFDVGPHPEYANMIDVLKKVAEASNGISMEEKNIILSFEEELLQEFRKRS